MKKKEVTLFGGTGLIGSSLLEILLKDDRYSKINLVTRRPFLVNNIKVNVHLIDFLDQKAIEKTIENSEIVFVSIGTTQAKVKGNKDAYRKIDFDIIYNVAKACKKQQVKHFLFVSSQGADHKSSSFYLKLKGEIEQAVFDLKLSCCSVFRPSLLLGKRNENRSGEQIAQWIMPLFSFLMPTNFKPIDAYSVAQSMVNISQSNPKGYNYFHYQEIKDSLL
ncbi:MAG: NAD(P)H-binding protein [Flavobacteriaceae bacterium]